MVLGLVVDGKVVGGLIVLFQGRPAGKGGLPDGGMRQATVGGRWRGLGRGKGCFGGELDCVSVVSLLVLLGVLARAVPDSVGNLRGVWGNENNQKGGSLGHQSRKGEGWRAEKRLVGVSRPATLAPEAVWPRNVAGTRVLSLALAVWGRTTLTARSYARW